MCKTTRRKKKPIPNFIALLPPDDCDYSPILGSGLTPEEAIKDLENETGSLDLKEITILRVENYGKAKINIEWVKEEKGK